MSINLLPEELTSARQHYSKRFRVLTAFLLFSLFFLIINGFLYFRIHALESQTAGLAEVRAEITWAQERLEELEEEIAWAEEELDALASIMNNSVKHTETIGILLYHLNPQVDLQQIILTGEGWLILRGKVKTMASVGELAASLGSDAYFLEVNVQELYPDPVGNHSFTLELLTQGRTDKDEI